MRRGTRQTVALGNDTWLFRVSSALDTVYVAINRGDVDATITGLPSTALRELVEGAAQQSTQVLVPARQVRIFAAP